MAIPAAFWITVNMTGPASGTVPGQATTFQIVTPWGQTQPCYTFTEALNVAFNFSSVESGKMGNYFNLGITNGLVTGSQTVPTSANLIQGTP